MKTRSVIVTGGLGFIGNAISERFLSSGAQVTIVDSLVSNVVEPSHFSSRYALAQIIAEPVTEYFSNPRGCLRGDLVVHAASLVGPAGILSHAGTIGADIVQSASKVIEYCKSSQVPLYYFSSAEVYGRSGVLDESMDIRIPPRYNARIEYALGKLTCESMIVNSRSRGLRALIIRPFNVAGPRQSRCGGFVMPTFVQQALSGTPLTVFGSGQQQRAFTDVNDVVDFVMRYAVGALGGTGRTLNVGNPANSTSIIDLAHRVIALLESNSEVTFTRGDRVYGPLYCEAESYQKLPDIAMAKQLGWEPKRSLDDIILDTAAFYRQNGDPLGSDVRRSAA
jgi:nucleoside-diphosphate-sugar epimerase